MASYSRRSSLEEKKNIRKALLYVVLSIISLALLFIYGLPALAKMAAFLSDLRGSSQPVEVNDTTPPAPPRINSLPEATNKTAIEISGSAEPDSTVKLFLNNNVEEVAVTNDGEFKYTFQLDKGENTVSALAKDNSGNESQSSDEYTITYDNTPPELEIISPEDGKTFYGSSQRQAVIEGKTNEEADVTINDRFVSVDEDGNFTFATSLEEGENKFKIRAEDKAGNTTEKEIILNFSS